MQVVAAPCRRPSPTKENPKSRYGRLAAATIEAKLEDALTLRAALVGGREQAYERTAFRQRVRALSFRARMQTKPRITLDPSQEAAAHRAGSVSTNVVAGAGTGRRVCSSRAHLKLVEDDGIRSIGCSR
jgi:hypothetical protein